MKRSGHSGPGLSPEALDTFKVICMPERITLYKRAARCVSVGDDAETRKAVQGLADFWKLDTAFVDPTLRLSDFRLLALDMDSTVVNIETLDEVASYAGKGEQVAAITEAAMRGEVDYKESLRRRVAMLAGVDAALLARVHDEKLALNDGAQQLVSECQRQGLKTLLATGGFTFFTERIKAKLNIDYTRSNRARDHRRSVDGQGERTERRRDHRCRRQSAGIARNMRRDRMSNGQGNRHRRRRERRQDDAARRHLGRLSCQTGSARAGNLRAEPQCA